MLCYIVLKNYATFDDEYGNEMGFLHFFVVNSKKFRSHLPQHQLQLPKVRQELCAISHAMVHSSEILPSFGMDGYKNLIMLRQNFMDQFARKMISNQQ